MISYCNYKGIGVIAYAPLMTGFLARPLGTQSERTKSVEGTFFEKKRRESDNKIIQRVEEIANKRGWTMSQVALAWVASKTDSMIVGMNSPARAQESAVADLTLTDEEVAYLEEP